ncbi:hypothetical protein [Entomohabitans teleogrylli]|nr:hypothetical protein [Entomohabitans teleogrylli]
MTGRILPGLADEAIKRLDSLKPRRHFPRVLLLREAGPAVGRYG